MVNKILKWFGLTMVILTVASMAAFAVQNNPDTLVVSNDGPYPLNQYLYYYQSPKKLSPARIYQLLNAKAFVKLYPNAAINAGLTKNYCYILFTIKNEQPKDDVFFFQLHQPWLNLATIYVKTDTGFVYLGQSGMSVKFNVRPYPYYDILFPLAMHSKAVNTYIAIIDNRGASLNLLPTLMNNNSFKEIEKKEYLLFGVLTGIMLFSLVVNIFLYVSLKEKIHLLYFLYVSSMLYWMYCNIALDFQYFYPNHPFIATISEYFAASAGFLTMANLITGFLGVTRKNSRFKLAMNILKYIIVVLPLLGFIIYKWFNELLWLKEAYMYIVVTNAIMLAVLFYAIAIEKIIQKVILGWFYLIGGCYIGFGIIKYCIYLLGGSLNSSVQTAPNDIQIGLVIEAVIIFIGIIYRYNLYKNEKEQLLVKLNKQQKETIQQIVTAQEDERKRIAQDIHDDVGSTLGTLLLHISNLPQNNDQKDWANTDHYQKSIDIGRKAINDLRNISHDLLPKDFAELGIFYILKNRIDELNIISNIRFTLITEGDDQSIENIFSITIYRIINELINNILKHSQASLATIQLLITTTEIIIMLEDNGIGINSGTGTGIGLKNIYSRTEFLHGTINIDDSTAGTTIIIEIPIEQ